jgi:hypothetical protein
MLTMSKKTTIELNAASNNKPFGIPSQANYLRAI